MYVNADILKYTIRRKVNLDFGYHETQFKSHDISVFMCKRYIT